MDIPARLGLGRPARIDPRRTLGLLTLAHAFNHAQAALLPFVFLAIIDQFGVTVADVAFMAAIATLVAGGAQLAYGWLTRRFTRSAILGWGNVVLGAFMGVTAMASSFLPFAGALIISKLGGSPQHPVGNSLLAEQFPPHRRGFAISAHIAGGNLGTLGVPLVATWLIADMGWGPTMVLFGLPALVVGLAIVAFVGESGAGRAAAVAQGSVRSAIGSVLRDRDQMLVVASSVAASGARGLGVLNLFVPLYLARVLGLDTATVALMLTVLLIGSVPAPIIAGWLSDRLGRKPVVVSVYVGGAAALAMFVVAGDDPALLWLGILLLSVFSFVESPQLQSLLADITPRGVRDASFGVYFTLVFMASAVWVAAYGAMVDLLGESAGLGLAFGSMAVSSLVAGLIVLPVRAEPRTREVREAEARADRETALGALTQDGTNARNQRVDPGLGVD